MDLKGLFKGLIGGIGFETTLPIGRMEDNYGEFVRHGYLLPLVGAIMGVLLGSAGIGLTYFPPSVGAALYVGLTYLLSGINHLDGLSDSMDGLVSGGDRESKKEVMMDEKVGIGGLIGMMMVILILYGGVFELFSSYSSKGVLLSLLGIEVLSKNSILVSLAWGSPGHQGMGSRFMEKVSSQDLLIGTLITLILIIPFWGLRGLITYLLSLVITFFLIVVGQHTLGGLSGDLLGAVGEIVRPISLTMLICLAPFVLKFG